jgi:hypothetical protein
MLDTAKDTAVIYPSDIILNLPHLLFSGSGCGMVTDLYRGLVMLQWKFPSFEVNFKQHLILT